MKIFFIIEFLFLLLCGLFARAENHLPHLSKDLKFRPTEAFNIHFSRGSDSDLWESNQLQVVSPHILSDLGWPYNFEPDHFYDFAARYVQTEKTQNTFFYSVREFSTEATWKYSKNFRTQVQFGLAESKNEISSSRIIGTGDVHFLWHTENSDTQVHFKKHLGSEWILATTSWMQSQTGWSLNPSWSLKSTQNSKLQIKLAHLWLSDENERKKIDIEWKYAFSTFPVWLWIGPGLERIQYQKSVNEYWSPSWVDTQGLRYDLSIPLFKHFQFQSGGSIHQINSSESDSGQGHYHRTGLSYGHREDFQFTISNENILSRQSHGQWKSSIWKLFLQWTLN